MKRQWPGVDVGDPIYQAETAQPLSETIPFDLRGRARFARAGPMNEEAFNFSQQQHGIVNEQMLSQFAEAVGNYLVANKLEFGGYEPYVDEEVVARFVGITSRRVLEMARDGEIPAHPIGSGSRKTWRFRLSEIEAHFSSQKNSTGATLNSAVPGATRRKQ